MGKSGIIANNMFKINLNNKIVSNKYMYYYLSQKNILNYLRSAQSSSTMPAINFGMLNNFVVNIPKLEKQEKIVKILETLDKKIELNNQINNNLYQISTTYYKSWSSTFVTNETVRFIDLRKLGNVVMGQSPKGESYNYEKIGLPLINGATDYENHYLKAQKYTSSPTKISNKGDLIFCIRATIGLLVICDGPYCLGRGVAGITDINDEYREYSFHIINDSIKEFKNMATGSVIVGISRNDIENISVKDITDEQIKEFHRLQKPIFDQMDKIRKENQILEQLRDILLPKLINGEINLNNIII